jgi:hypothetical protein
MFFCMFFRILSINHVISQSRQACQPGPDVEWQAISGQVFLLSTPPSIPQTSNEILK